MLIEAPDRFPWRSLLVIAGGYLAFGVVWILVSDLAASWLAPSWEVLERWQTVKGAVFVGLSALLVAALIWRERNRLRALSSRWRATIDNAPIGFWVIDPQARTVLVNPFLAESLGYTPEEMQGRTPYEFVDSANRAVFEAQIGQLGDTDHRNYEIELTTRSGTIVPALFNATTLRDDAGEVLGAFAFVTDLSLPKERQRALVASWESLSRQQEFTSAVIDRLPGSFFVFDDRGRMLLWNQHLVEVQGFSDSRILNMAPSGFFTDDSLPEVEQGIQDVFRHGQGTAEGVVGTPDGRRLPYRLHATRLDGFGLPLAVGLGVDISREKAVESSLVRSNRALRTLSRSNEALVHAEDEASLLGAICDILVDEGGYQGAWIGILDDREPPRLEVRAARKEDDRSVTLPEPLVVTPDDPVGAPFARVRQSAEPTRLGAAGECRDEQFDRAGPGGRQVEVLPLGTSPVNGFLVVCAAGEGPFEAEERQLLSELAADLDFGMRALRSRSHQRLAATVFGQSIEGIAVTDPDERIVMVNDAFTRITGYGEEEVLGQTPRLLNSGVHDRRFFREMWQSLTENGVWQGEMWNRRKDGEVYPQWQTISEVRDEEGQLVNYVTVFSDITRSRRTEEELNFLTYHDPLTGLPNRSLFREYLSHALDNRGRWDRALAMVALDLKGFGTINDSLGPAVGDAVLQQASQRLRDSLRPGDRVSRPGADEFWVLLEDLDRGEDADRVVRKLLADLSQPLTVEGRTLRLEAVAGIALPPGDGSTADEVIASAVTALHRAQESGGRPVQFFSQELGHRASRRLDLEQALRQAIEGEELRVWFQPQMDLASQRPVAVEALVRWEHPEWGLVPPAEFIPVAEASGLVVPLGEWVLEQAIRHFAAWRQEGLAVQRVGVNVAAGQLSPAGLADQVGRHLDETGLPAGCLELEVTEEGYLADLAGSLETLNAVAELGSRIAIDDFGTGYSSLAYLRRLPVDTLKIDKAFIDGLPDDEDNRSITEAILAVAGQMGLDVVAEGVEQRVQADWLRDQGIPWAQGFLWARPQPPEALADLFRAPDSAFSPHLR